MRIRLNGEPYEVAPGATVRDLLQGLSLPPERVAVERNLEIVRREEFAGRPIEEGDRIEIVHFVGGG